MPPFGAGSTGRGEHVGLFRRVRYRGVYDRIDVDYYGVPGGLEYDFRIAPGADPDNIVLRLHGLDSYRIDPDGDLVFAIQGRQIKQKAPLAYRDLVRRYYAALDSLRAGEDLP